MLFNSYSFFVFFPIVVVVYFLLPKRVSYLWLLTASYYFYMGWNAKYALLLLLSTAITYISGIVIQWLNDNRPEKIEAKKWVVVGCIVANLAILFFFKYFNFTIESINAVLDHEFADSKYIVRCITSSRDFFLYISGFRIHCGRVS